MIDRFAASGDYDIVLIDSRAGLHETTAAVLLGLGADTLLFGLDQPQTFLGYRLLLAHLARFRIDPADDWRDRLQFVHAKASDDPKKQRDATERFRALYDLIGSKENLPAEEAEPLTAEPLTADDFQLEWSDDDVDVVESSEIRPPIHISDDARYRDFDPLSDKSSLDSSTFTATFSSLLDWIDILTEDPSTQD
jgi:hypothetical protein